MEKWSSGVSWDEFMAANEARRPAALARRREQHRQPGVYFIAAGTEMKIGHSADPRRRLGALQTAASRKLELIHVIVETDKAARERLEDELHERFDEHRIRGEWFLFGPTYNYATRLCFDDCLKGVIIL